MDVAYDHITEESLSPEDANQQRADQQQTGGLNTEFQEAFKAVSSSPWGAKLGGFFGQVKKQSESYLSEAQKEYSNASTQASKGFSTLQSSLKEHTRGISIPTPDAGAGPASFSDPTFALPEQEPSKPTASSSATKADVSNKDDISEEAPERPESLSADIVKEATSMVSRFRLEATKRLKDVQKAEDAADEALLKFGTNLKTFLRDAVTVTAPEVAAAAGLPIPGTSTAKGKDGTTAEVLFETNDAEGRRVFHSSRFDAQLHVIHTTATSFTKDPESGEYEKWKQEFDVERYTDRIAADMEKYEDLRRAMGKLVPETVDYKTFWCRYYFLKMVVEEEERRRKEVLKGAAAEPVEEVGWGSDDEDEERQEQEDQSSTPVNGNNKAAQSSSTTLNAASPSKTKTQDLLKPDSPRRSHEEDEGKSVADSDASYDIVSGATSRTPGTPKEDKKESIAEEKKADSDDEDWE